MYVLTKLEWYFSNIAKNSNLCQLILWLHKYIFNNSIRLVKIFSSGSSIWVYLLSEFPHYERLIVLGLSLGIQGLFSFLGNLLPYMFQYGWQRATFPSCCMTYFLINIILGLVALSLYVYVTRGYQYRMRDEPYHIHFYVEEYYSKIQKEGNYLQ